MKIFLKKIFFCLEKRKKLNYRIQSAHRGDERRNGEGKLRRASFSSLLHVYHCLGLGRLFGLETKLIYSE